MAYCLIRVNINISGCLLWEERTAHFLKQNDMKAKISLLLIWSLLSLKIFAADYVDDINNATGKNEAGHQVIYEMNIGMFTQAGTFAAAQQQLSELKQLGVDIVWLMPIYPRGSSKSPYAVMDFESVNTNYGNVDDVTTFVAAAHQQGMKVILDWVPNQTANEHPWRTAHPTWFNGKHSYPDISDLNYDNSDLKAEMMRIMKSWIDRCDIDGFRFDFVTNTKPSYWLTTNQELKDYAATKGKEQLILLAEIDTNDNQRFSNKTNNIGFTHDYAWWLQETVLRNGFAKDDNATKLKQNLQRFFDDSKTLGLSRMVYLTNHDQNFNDGGATLSDMYGDYRYALTALQFTLYGMPLIYNGQETGGNQVLDYFNDTKINWSTKDVKMKNTLRTLCALKHAVPALSDRADVDLITLSSNSNVLAFTRTNGDSKVLVVLNMVTTSSTANITGLDAGEWSLWLNSETISQGTSRQQQTFSTTQSLTLEAKGYRVYVKGTFSEEAITATGIRDVRSERPETIGAYYDLSGRKVSRAEAKKGIYIRNGKKYVIK